MKNAIELLKEALHIIDEKDNKISVDYQRINEWTNDIKILLEEEDENLENKPLIIESELEQYSNRTYNRYISDRTHLLYDWNSEKKFPPKLWLKRGDKANVVRTHYLEQNITYFTLFKWYGGTLYSITYQLDGNGKWFRDVNSTEYHIMMLKNKYDYYIPKHLLNKWY